MVEMTPFNVNLETAALRWLLPCISHHYQLLTTCYYY